MIALLRGYVVEVMSDAVIVDTMGIGFEVLVHARAAQTMPAKGQEVVLFTRLVVSDSELKLYGFLKRSELELFHTLTGISGLGPKIALAVLERFDPDQFYRIVSSQDLKALTTVAGVGKKSGERILFELKDKVPQLPAGAGQEQASEVENLLEALASLGYGRSEVYPHILGMIERNELGSLEENIKTVLRLQALSGTAARLWK
jgi:Holliday junction DNA helicase RuvA